MDSVSLLEYTRRIKTALASNPQIRGVWVTAELSDVNRHPSGHCYMELLEKNDRGETVAKMRATIWKFNLYEIERKFYAATGRRFNTGMKVMLRLESNMHEVYSLTANVTDIDPSYTLGDMERLRREILERLTREGVINNNKQIHVPLNPQRIAVISAAGAAGYGDFVNQLQSSAEEYVFYPFLFPALLQGKQTSASVRAALEQVEMTIDLWDCVVIIRGGGSTTDLNGFDDYDLARAVATFPLPVIVGIGHERDRTVLDEIASVRCKTPTAVAAYLIDALRYAERLADDAADKAIDLVRNRIATQQERLAAATGLIPTLARAALERASERLDRIPDKILTAKDGAFRSASQHLDHLTTTMASAADGAFRSASQHLDHLATTMATAAETLVQRQKDRIEATAHLIDVLSPVNTMRRGYTITRLNGKAITSADSVSEGDILETTTLSGKITSRILPPDS